MAARKNKTRTLIKRQPITQDSLLEAKYVCDGKISPSENFAAYVLAETSGKGDKQTQRLSIWRVDLEGGAPKRLTRGKGNSWSPKFSESGDTLYFLSNRDKVTQVYAMPVDGGEAEAVTSMKQGVMDYVVTSSGQLVFTSPTKVPEPRSKDQHARIDRPWYRFDPVPGYLEDHNYTVFVAKSGGKPKPLSDGVGMIMGLSVTNDGKKLVYRVTGLKKHRFVEADVMVCSLTGKSATQCVLENSVVAQTQWHSDGRTLICAGSLKGISDMTSIFTLSAEGKISQRTATLDLQPSTAFETHVPAMMANGMFETEDGKSLMLTISRGGEAHVNKLSLTGRAKADPLSSGQESHWLFDKHENQLLLARQDSTHPPELYLQDAETGEKRQLTNHNEKWHATQLWPETERVIATVKRGVEVEGWIMKPKNARAPYKTILVIHGGPHGAWGNTFWCDMHELVGAGYAVAFMNPRGSTGYGKAFMQSIHGVWGYPEIEDFNSFMDELVKRKISHPDKFGVTGISGGGHLSAWLIGHSKRFKAAVPEQGVYNMLSMWGESDAGQPLLDVELGTTPQKDPMKYWKHSPIAYANKVTTPTMLLQGNQDIRCPITQADELFYALQHHGCKAELIHLEGCNHGGQLRGRIPIRRYRMTVMREWFDQHIK